MTLCLFPPTQTKAKNLLTSSSEGFLLLLFVHPLFGLSSHKMPSSLPALSRMMVSQGDPASGATSQRYKAGGYQEKGFLDGRSTPVEFTPHSGPLGTFPLKLQKESEKRIVLAGFQFCLDLLRVEWMAVLDLYFITCYICNGYIIYCF